MVWPMMLAEDAALVAESEMSPAMTTTETVHIGLRNQVRMEAMGRK
jgi:hypothetical protein